MAYGKKIVLHCLKGYRLELDVLVEQFIRDGVIYVGVVGPECSRIEDIVDELCVGNREKPYFMLTASHEGESVAEAVEFAESLSGEYSGDVQLVEF